MGDRDREFGVLVGDGIGPEIVPAAVTISLITVLVGTNSTATVPAIRTTSAAGS